MSRAELKWIDFRGENFRDESQSSTSSNVWADKLTGTTGQLKEGSVLISAFSELGQSKGGRRLGYRVQWKPSSSPTWIDISESDNGVTNDNEWEARSCWDIVQLSASDTIDVRVQFGQTTGGGIASIRKVRVGVVRIGQLGDFI